MQKSISAIIGRGSIRHNNRDFYADNVDRERTKDNVILCKEDLHIAYHNIFDEALEEYNAKQKRKDRQIQDYYEHIRLSKQEKLFYEVIFQIGDMKDTAVGTDDAVKACEILEEFYKRFQADNPQIHIFNAVIHNDEATPHLHIDFIPVATENTRGLSTRNSLTKALMQQGFKSEGKLNTSSKLWIDNEKKRLAACMQEHGIEHEEKGIHQSNLSVEEFKLQKRMQEVAQLEESITELDKKLDAKKLSLEELADKEKSVKNIEKIRTGRTLIKGDIIISPNDYDSLITNAKRYFAHENNEKKLVLDIKNLKEENIELKKTVSAQGEEISRLKSLRERLNINKLQRELSEVKARLEKVMKFIDVMGLRKKLEQFLHPRIKRSKEQER